MLVGELAGDSGCAQAAGGSGPGEGRLDHSLALDPGKRLACWTLEPMARHLLIDEIAEHRLGSEMAATTRIVSDACGRGGGFHGVGKWT